MQTSWGRERLAALSRGGDAERAVSGGRGAGLDFLEDGPGAILKSPAYQAQAVDDFEAVGATESLTAPQQRTGVIIFSNSENTDRV